VNGQEWPVSARDHLNDDAWKLLPQDFRDWFGESGVVLSLHVDDAHVGAILLCFDEDYRLNPETASFLAAVGRTLGAYLHVQRVRSRDHELGVLQERRRIGDELHANLSQDIAALGLAMESFRLDLEEDWKHCENRERQASMESVQLLVSALQTELRQQMLSLRADADLGERPLIDGVSARVRTFGHSTCIRTAVEHTKLTDCPVPLSVTSQLIRVLQECLNNVQLHACAASVTVRLHQAERIVRLEVIDDGCGFSMEDVPESRLGLRIMRERLAQVHGVLRIDSQLAQGTSVMAEVPLSGGREVAVL
jgi:NarL family two-component system sensor histidine kinase LiaS